MIVAGIRLECARSARRHDFGAGSNPETEPRDRFVGSHPVASSR